MNVASRIAQLEKDLGRARRAGQCAACAHWPRSFVRYVDNLDPAAEPVPAPEVPPPCPNCGRLPMVIQIECVDNWRACRQEVGDG
jgi:hypothetical protein